MTSINGVTAGTAGVAATATPDALSSPAAVSAGAAAGSAANLRGFLDFIAAATDGASSGMRAPANPEDAEALLLLVESKLDKTVSQALGAKAAARLGQAQTAGSLSLGAARAALSNDQLRQTADQKQLDQDTKVQSSLQVQVVQLTRDIAAREAADQNSPPNTDDPTLDEMQASLAALQGQLTTVGGKVTTETNIVAADQRAVDTDNLEVDAALSALNQVLSQVATGLRTDVGRDADAAAGASKHRDIAYGETSDIAKRHRDGEVARAERQAPGGAETTGRARERAEGAAKRDGDRGGALADGYLAAVADALATIRAFVAAPPPTVPRTAAAEAGGRLRLAL